MESLKKFQAWLAGEASAGVVWLVILGGVAAMFLLLFLGGMFLIGMLAVVARNPPILITFFWVGVYGVPILLLAGFSFALSRTKKPE